VGCLFDEPFRVQGRDVSWLACKSTFCLCDLLKKNAPDPAGALFVQSEVRTLFHHVQRESKFHQKGGIGSVVHLENILPDSRRTSLIG